MDSPPGPNSAAADALAQQGLAFHRAGKWQQAAQLYQRALALDGKQVDATHLLGCLLLQADQVDNAHILLARAVALAPDNAAILGNFGHCLLKLKQHDKALAAFQRADTLGPSADSQHMLGVAFEALGQQPEAIVAYRTALSRTPSHPGALTNLLNQLRPLALEGDAAEERTQLALTVLHRASAPPGLTAMAAQIAIQAGAFDIVEPALARALAAQPDHAHLQIAQGMLLHEQGRPDAALPWFERAMTTMPHDTELLALLAAAYLAAGHLERGFRAFDARLRHPAFGNALKQLPNVRRWRGEALDGMTIRLLAEQGQGDLIQFMRLAPALCARGATRVELELPPRLHRLAQTLPGVKAGKVVLMSPGATNTTARLQTPVVSALSGLQVATDADITALVAVPYLHAEPQRVAQWAARLDDEAPRDGRPRIAVAWQGNPRFSGDKRRSLPAQALAPLAQHARLIAIQRGVGREQGAELRTLVDLGDDVDDGPDGFLDTAAIMENCDLVVCCCTAVAHLAGALGRPVWLALSHVPDWRWQMARPETPWYPTMRLFRQAQPGDWAGVMAAMAHALSGFVAGQAPRA
jgi:tetratricopeptide (TPR) repeat protein